LRSISRSWKKTGLQAVSCRSLPLDVAAQIKTLHFDVAAATIPPYLLALQQLVPTSQLLTSFDFPFMPVQTIPRAIDVLESL
jgi:hypothetical protein